MPVISLLDLYLNFRIGEVLTQGIEISFSVLKTDVSQEIFNINFLQTKTFKRLDSAALRPHCTGSFNSLFQLFSAVRAGESSIEKRIGENDFRQCKCL